jgi:hypothetical protein
MALVTWVARQCQPRLWFRMEIIGYGLMISALSLIMLIVFLQRSFEVGVLVGLTIAPFISADSFVRCRERCRHFDCRCEKKKPWCDSETKRPMR